MKAGFASAGAASTGEGRRRSASADSPAAARPSQRVQGRREHAGAPAPAARRSADEEKRRREELDNRRRAGIELAVQTFDALPQLGAAEAYALARNSLQASFAPAADKLGWVGALDATFAAAAKG